MLYYPMVYMKTTTTTKENYLLSDLALYCFLYGGVFFWAMNRNKKPKGYKNKKVIFYD